MHSDLTNFLAIWAVLVLPALFFWNVIGKRKGRRRFEEAKLLVLPFIIGFCCIEVGGSMLEEGGGVGFMGLALLGVAGYITYTLIRMPLED